MDERPKEFDDRLLSYMPGLQSLARRMQPEDPDALVNDTFAFALSKWKNFRPDGGFWLWISMNMRAIARKNRSRKVPHMSGIAAAEHVQELGNQEHSADLSMVRVLLNDRAGTCLIRHASGETYREIAADLGVSYERVRQLCDVARARLLSEVA